MKRKQYYAAGMIILLLLAVVCLYQRETPGSVRTGYTSAGVSEAWNGLVAKQVNQKGIHLTVDSTSVNSTSVDSTGAKDQAQPFMAQNRQIMIPVELLRDAFFCKAGIYEDHLLKLYRSDRSLTADYDTGELWIGEEQIVLQKPFGYRDHRYYLSAEALALGLDYRMEWNAEQGTLRFTDNRPGASKLPSAFDPRGMGLSAPVMDQGRLGTCWAFASVGALEQALLPEESQRFSVDHMSLNNGYSWGQDTGGEYTMSMAYLLSWKGPVPEAADPYGDGKTNPELEAVKHVQEIQLIPSKDRNAIKSAVYLYGSVQTSIYCEINGQNDQSAYYNPETNSYCYIGMDKINHDTLIVGWDDSYPADAFRTKPEGNGAFLCMNSWGEEFGDGGYFWVSYYDSNIGIYNVAYTKIESAENYDRIYQSDLCGWVGQLGYGKEDAYFANLYSAAENEMLEAVGFYAVAPDTDYEVYVVPGAKTAADLTFQYKAASGSFSNAGYYTVTLDQPVELEKGESFAVIVYIRSPGEERPVAVEYSSEDGAVTADLSDGCGFISLKGTSWQSAEQKYKCNLCLKAYTTFQK